MPNEPCSPRCPAGDCAGCAFPPLLARCIPVLACPQVERCARRDPRLSDCGRAIDATALHVGKFCPLFVDARGALLEAA